MKLPIDHPLIINILFHPRKSFNQITDSDFKVSVEKDVHVGIKTYLKDKSYPTIIHFHGNAELAEEYQFFANTIHQNNINLICCDYRGYGHSNGQPTCSNLMDDSLKVFRFIKTYLRDKQYSDDLFLMGRSLGSASVAHICNHEAQNINGLIIESGFCSEESLFKLFQINPSTINYKDSSDGFDNQTKIANYYGPLLIIHATDDHILPFTEGKLLHKTCPSNNKEFVKIEQANHNNLLSVNPNKYFKSISQFINSHSNKN